MFSTYMCEYVSKHAGDSFVLCHSDVHHFEKKSLWNLNMKRPTLYHVTIFSNRIRI